MKQDKEGNLIHEDHNGSFEYNGTIFIIDDFKDYYLVTERNFRVKRSGKTLEEAKKKVMTAWDNFKSTTS